jgi:hypothetical protein
VTIAGVERLLRPPDDAEHQAAATATGLAPRAGQNQGGFDRAAEMDIIAHTLWAGVGVALLRRRRPVPLRTAAATVCLAALPDVLHLLPIVAWWVFGTGGLNVVLSYAVAVPGQEPGLPEMVKLVSHHLHCIMHSAIVAGAVTLLLYALRRSLWIPLLGWWLHIVIDVFTHSADYYAVPVLYPLSDFAFDGVAWNEPWMLVLNYAALSASAWWIYRSARATRAA